ncbi:MAG: CopG family transcriptional regulator [Burkholderiales bacterium]
MLRTITIRLQDRLLAQIDAEARSRRVTRADLVRERLAMAKAKKVSVWDGMQDLVLTEDRAPVDLASNNVHLRGYGRSGSR